MKNNQFRSNAISTRGDGQTAAELSVHPLAAQTKTEDSRAQRTGEIGKGWRDHSEGRGSGWGASQDIGMMAGGGGWIFCSDIAGLAPSELDIKSPCQVLPVLKDT